MGHVTFGSSPYSPDSRLSDADRTDALNQLAQAVGEGRLTVSEFEDRSDDIMRAQTRGELVPVFRDIPVVRQTEIKAYTQGDIDRARQAGSKPKLATALVGTLGLSFATIALTAADMAIAAVGMIMLIPVLWILLYVAKVGPKSWHVPSTRQIERQAKREVRALTAVQRAEQKEIEAQMWAQRRQQAGEVAGEAMNLAKKKFNQWNGT